MSVIRRFNATFLCVIKAAIEVKTGDSCYFINLSHSMKCKVAFVMSFP